MLHKETDGEMAQVAKVVQDRINKANTTVPFATLERIDEAKHVLRALLRAAGESEDRIASLVVQGLSHAMRLLDKAKENPSKKGN